MSLKAVRRQARARRSLAAKAANKKHQQKRLEMVNRMKDMPCADCKMRYPPEVMDFDHRPGVSKLANISRIKTRSIEALLTEIAKCDVVCANCHRLRTFTRRQDVS